MSAYFWLKLIVEIFEPRPPASHCFHEYSEHVVLGDSMSMAIGILSYPLGYHSGKATQTRYIKIYYSAMTIYQIPDWSHPVGWLSGERFII